jgi:hypothetical protein
MCSSTGCARVLCLPASRFCTNMIYWSLQCRTVAASSSLLCIQRSSCYLYTSAAPHRESSVLVLSLALSLDLRTEDLWVLGNKAVESVHDHSTVLAVIVRAHSLINIAPFSSSNRLPWLLGNVKLAPILILLNKSDDIASCRLWIPVIIVPAGSRMPVGTAASEKEYLERLPLQSRYIFERYLRRVILPLIDPCDQKDYESRNHMPPADRTCPFLQLPSRRFVLTRGDSCVSRKVNERTQMI